MPKNEYFPGTIVFAIAVVLLAFTVTSRAQSGRTPTPSTSGALDPAQRAERAFLSGRTRFQNEQQNPEAAWKFGRACFDWAEFAKDNKQRAEIASQGIVACRQVVEQKPKMVEGHYYLGMNLGQLARTKRLGALRLVSEMEREFEIARDLDENFDFAGPHRNLGLLYLEAPGWPTSIGSRSKARQHLERAAQLAPDYPENRLNLLEAYLKWSDKNGAQREFDALAKLLPAARKHYSGEQWESTWIDWEMRWRKVQAQFAEQEKMAGESRKKKQK